MRLLTLFSFLVATKHSERQDQSVSSATTSHCIGHEYRNTATTKCFWLTNGTHHLVGANIECAQNGGMLATIDEQDQAVFVKQTFFPKNNPVYVWLGIILYKDTWTSWIGINSTWSAWSKNEPKAGTPSILLDTKSVQMETAPSFNKARGLCEKNVHISKEPRCENASLNVEGHTTAGLFTNSSQTVKLSTEYTVAASISANTTVSHTQPLGENATECPGGAVVKTTTVYDTSCTVQVVKSLLYTTIFQTQTLKESPVGCPTIVNTPTCTIATDERITDSATQVFESTTTNDDVTSSQTLPSSQDLTQKLVKIKNDLTLDKTKLSSRKRKLLSAPDTRISSLSIGVFSLVLVIFPFLVTLIIDVPRCFQHVRNPTVTNDDTTTAKEAMQEDGV